MNCKLAFSLVLIGLVALLAADTDCTRINPATGMGDYNCTVIHLPPEEYQWLHIQPTDVSIGNRDIFAKTRLNLSSTDKRLVVSLEPTCEDENLVLQVTYDRQPVPNATVGLYSQGGGRKLVSEVSTDADGWAIFGPKKAGRYDLVATKYVYEQDMNDSGRTFVSRAYPLGQLILAIDLCDQPASMPARINYSASNEAPGGSGIIYSQGFERRDQGITLPDGRKAVRMDVLYTPLEDLANVTLLEFVPGEIASNSSAVGFEQNYPESIRTANGTLAIEWRLSGLAKSLIVQRSYVILRPPEAVDARTFGSPVLLDANRTIIAGANAMAVVPPQAPKKTEGWKLDLPQIPLWVSGLAILVLIAIVAGFVWTRMDSEKKEK